VGDAFNRYSRAVQGAAHVRDPWRRIGFYEARELVDFDSLREVPAWLERGLARPAVQRGLNITHAPRDENVHFRLSREVQNGKHLRRQNVPRP
jgi:hypothetical protein